MLNFVSQGKLLDSRSSSNGMLNFVQKIAVSSKDLDPLRAHAMFKRGISNSIPTARRAVSRYSK